MKDPQPDGFHGKMIRTFTAALVALSLCSTAMAQGMIVPAAPTIAAKSYIMIDANSGEILIEGNADDQHPPASLSKMMTSYVAEVELTAGRLSLDDRVRVSERAWRTGGSKMFVLVDSEVTVEDLMRGIVIQSGNDASIAIAEHLAGSEENFAEIMNQYGNQMGLTNTWFGNSTGLPESMTGLPPGYTSARDMAELARRVIQDHPQFYGWYSEREFTYADITQSNRNRLLWQNPSVDGLKTGYTADPGYSLVASAVEDDMRLITVVMGTASEQARLQETQKMLGYGFRYFESVLLHQGERELEESRIWAGQSDTVSLGLADDLYITIPKGSGDTVRTAFDINAQLEAPVAVGDVLGQIRVTRGDDLLVERDLVALSAVEQGSLFKRIWDRIILFFIGLFS
ncbi:MAG: D-alanyl-D-alanine carboxypeptidase [Natronospirillum sp.]|uniref:D-alanyl-D-alanine carboxypeptidase family protein n=1 Tax=Natronospirillum sp. TaxID=2812955 RepID=UPI0025E868B4|nr:D-alanyl-D-alanine carboxypeptidase family protein [Natronospirillum sp.]MCH8551072.1 D-alanyl-D-alanine carboxypeptidase [Natronospirillum sp.]